MAPAALAFALFVCGCGTRNANVTSDAGPVFGGPGSPDPDSETGESGETGETGETGGPGGLGGIDAGPGPGFKFDTLVDSDAPIAAPAECIECWLTISSQQSGVLAVTGDTVFATAELSGEVVYAIGDYDGGRFIASADSSLPFNEVTDCPLREWLADRLEPPRILWFGWTPNDGPIPFDIEATVSDVHLPPEYIGEPAALAADYDIVMYLEASSQFDGGDEPSDAEMQTLLDYVSVYGGGLYVVSEFADPVTGVYLGLADLASVNRLLLPMGVEALQSSLDWGDVAGKVEFSCFPGPVG